ncbi:MAG: LysM peptidoglycan-binding domain-containing protein, partial [Chloroflexota bacterium]
MKRTLSIFLALAIFLSAFPIHSVTAQGQTYTVQAGDNLYRIALKFGTTVAAIQTANSLTTTVVRIGQVLIIPGGSSAAAPAAVAAASSPGKYTVVS